MMKMHFDKNFTIQVMHDPNKDEDNDGLTYSQELPPAPVTTTPIPMGPGLLTDRIRTWFQPHRPELNQLPTVRFEPFEGKCSRKLPIGAYVGSSSPATRIKQTTLPSV